MKPEGTVQYNSLSWVKKQLDAVLADAQTSLSDYIEDSGNTPALEQCIEHLRLVYGTLQMVEVYGAAMLAEEMELTARAQLDGLIEKPEEVYDVLMRAMLQLPDYLEGLQAGNQDTPITLMPLMNDMRAARKEKLLSESVLFLPDVNDVDVEELSLGSAATKSGELAGEAKRLRTHYQLGLLDLLRNNKHSVGLKRMNAVIESLQKVSADAAVKRFWIVVSSLLEAVSADQSLANNITVKGLLGSVDRQIKLLIGVGENDFTKQFSQELLKNILYYVGTTQAAGPRVTKVQQAYKLEKLLSDDSSATDLSASMGGINAELFDTVSQGIREDLATVKDTLEIFMQSSDKDVEQLSSVVSQVEKIGDTYGMLGFGAVRQKVLDQRDVMEKIIKGESEASEEIVMDIASALLDAETKLDDYIAGKSGLVSEDDDERIVPSSEYRKVMSTVVEEGQKNFIEAKDAILEYAAGKSGVSHLTAVVQRLEEVRGVAMMLSAERVELLIAGLKDYVHIALQSHQRQPEMEEQDTLADLVTSIEYYFEALTEGRPGVDQGLQTGERALDNLTEVVKQYADVEPPVVESEDVLVPDDEVAVPFEFEKEASLGSSTVSASAGIVVPEDHEEYEILGDDADEEIVEIFVEEAVEVLGSLHEYMPKWKGNANDEESLTIVRRNFHTLKGSGRLIGAALIGEFSWKIESMLNRVMDEKIETSDELFSLMDEVLAVLPQLIEQLRGNREPIPNIYQLMALAEVLTEGNSIESIANEKVVGMEAAEEISVESAHDLNDEVMEVSGSLSDEDEMFLDAINGTDVDDEITIGVPSAGDELVLELTDDLSNENEMLFDINGGDSETIDIADLGDIGSVDDLDDEITIGVPSGGDDLVLGLTNDLSNENEMLFDINGDDSETIDIADLGDTGSVGDIVDLDNLDLSLGGDNDFLVEIDAASEADEAEGIFGLSMDPMLFQIYYDESLGHLQLIKDMLTKHESATQRLAANKDLIRALHTLFGSARTAEVEAIAEICSAIEKYAVIREDSEDSLIPDDVVRIITDVVANVDVMLAELKAGRMPESNKELLNNINKVMQTELHNQLQQPSTQHEIAIQVSEDQGPDQNIETGLAEESENKEILYTYGDVDDDLIDIFLEEAEELLEDCENTLNKLHDNEEDLSSLNELQRHMHTLKGGARMATLVPVGDLTHELESMVIALAEKKIEPSKAFFDVLHESLDTLITLLANVKQRQALKSPHDLIKNIIAIMHGETIDQRTVERFDIEVEDLQGDQIVDLSSNEAVTDDTKKSKSDVAVKSASSSEDPHRRKSDEEAAAPHWGERAADTNFKESHEQVRVRADLLNNLVNYAGEVNIHHARMGKQITDISFNLKELDQTVVRLKEQLRKLEIETEIQIRSSYEKEADDYDENFDPLEMDRYSTLQQLARSLSETASDVDSIKSIISEIVGDSETLLLQESRISTDLQEGLMRTRMVRFGGMSTRLRRIIRQTSRELDKEVNVEIVGEEQEVDRTILDRVVAPLEHMLRNAVAHGIELPKDRQAAGKSEAGTIRITVGRQGTDVIVRVEDDGAGIDVDAIRKKAIKQGLLAKNNELTDHDVLQFILKSGFSTAEEVTQVAGRGVGMDVVDSEIKQLGGVLEIDTERGKGTSFRVRLPLTLAINQALLVSTGEDIYAVPLASIEGVVRITGVELQGFYDSNDLEYEFNNVNYELKHLNFLLTGQQQNYADQGQLFPVLLVNVGDQHFALHVDDLLGRREIVIKPVGAQISTVRGVAGATILADGRVVLILEMSALVVGESLFKEIIFDDQVEVVVEDIEPTIMVVDDSITIRKVTERILGRHGMKVILATDGVDATSKLQEDVPDLMLLDIEMPRMDGFELATYMRNEERLKNIPIIMITSRTGTKHKERAKSIGVEQYLGKPFQEEELMKNINALLGLNK